MMSPMRPVRSRRARAFTSNLETGVGDRALVEDFVVEARDVAALSRR